MQVLHDARCTYKMVMNGPTGRPLGRNPNIVGASLECSQNIFKCELVESKWTTIWLRNIVCIYKMLHAVVDGCWWCAVCKRYMDLVINSVNCSRTIRQLFVRWCWITGPENPTISHLAGIRSHILVKPTITWISDNEKWENINCVASGIVQNEFCESRNVLMETLDHWDPCVHQLFPFDPLMMLINISDFFVDDSSTFCDKSKFLWFL